MPLLLSSGYRIRSLVPTLQFNLDNTEIITPEGQSNRASLVLASVQYNEYVRKARLEMCIRDRPMSTMFHELGHISHNRLNDFNYSFVAHSKYGESWATGVEYAYMLSLIHIWE